MIIIAVVGGLSHLGYNRDEAPKKGEPKQLQSNPQGDKPGTQGKKEEQERSPARIDKQPEELPAPFVDEKAEKERLEKERQRQQEERERKADAKLSLALDLENNNRPEGAKRWFQEILRDFPGTKAAEKAAEHLKGL